MKRYLSKGLGTSCGTCGQLSFILHAASENSRLIGTINQGYC